MNSDLFVRLIPSRDYEMLRRNFNRQIICREFGDVRAVVVKKPDLAIPENLCRISLNDIDIEIPLYYRDRDKLFMNALQNTRYFMPPRLYFSEKIEGKDMYHTGVFMEEEYRYGNDIAMVDRKRSMEGMRLTNSSWFGGAVAAFYPGTAKRLSYLLDSDFYMAFPSPHEARIHSCKWTNVHDVHNAITEWNRIKYGGYRGWQFSSCVYRYCRSRDEFQTVEYYDWNSLC